MMAHRSLFAGESIRAAALTGLCMALAACATPATTDRADLAIAAQFAAADAISPSYDPDNLIARTVSGAAGLPVVFENDRAIAFLIDRPAARGHYIVALKHSQARNFLELDDAESLAVMQVAQRVATAEVEVLKAQGFTLRQNNGSASSVAQYHLHVIPRWSGDSIPPGVGAPVKIASLAGDAASIRAAASE